MIILLTFFFIISLSAASVDQSEMMKLITGNEDPGMTVNDLAYFLVIHDFDATPKKDYVEVRLNTAIYKLVPNGSYPGLANVTIKS